MQEKVYYCSKCLKILEKSKPRLEVKPTIKEDNANDKKEKLIIYLLINYPNESYEKIRAKVSVEDIKNETNKAIIKKLYEEFEKGNSNINGIIDELGQEEQNQITMIMADNYEINDFEKAIDDLIQIYQKEKLNNRKFEILELLEATTDINQKKELEKELSNIIIRLAKIK